MALKPGNRSAAVFALVTCVGIAFQLAISFLVPSVSVAYLDGGAFRSWNGFGVRETICLSLLLSVAGMWGRSPSSSTRHIASVVIGMLIATLLVFLAMQLPLLVAVVWCTQCALQATIVAQAVSRLIVHSVRTNVVLGALGGVVSLACLAIGYAFPSPTPDETFFVEVDGIGKVNVDCFMPDGDGPFPAVVVFHGVEGTSRLSRTFFHYPNCKAISKQGYATFLVRYFDAFPYDDLMKNKEGRLDVEAVEEIRRQDYQEWIEVARVALGTIHERVDVQEMVVIGYSLGCYVGSAATSLTCGGGYPKGFVGNFGGVWPEVEIDASFPPSRLYHGEMDSVVPVEEAKKAVAKLIGAGVSDVRLTVYPNQEHLPAGPTASVVRTDTEAFLRDVLGSIR